MLFEMSRDERRSVNYVKASRELPYMMWRPQRDQHPRVRPVLALRLLFQGEVQLVA